MKVVVPFAHPSWPLAAVQLALKQDGVEPELHHMTDDEAYFRLVSRLWKEGETFTLVEHDIVVWPGGISELENCPEAWCAFPYYSSIGWINDGLGCTKFSGKLMKEQPGFFEEPFPSCCQHTKYYCGLDRLIAHRLQELNLTPHVHKPGVTNLNSRWT